jgi:geranylgeranyl reductase family protein
VREHPEVVVVGGGPGGAAAAYWLARRGHPVLLVEKHEYPREKVCGDGLTPRAITQLTDMGFDFDVPELHRIHGLRAYGGGTVLELPWPEHSEHPAWGAVIRRADLDGQVAALAAAQGVMVREKTEARAIVEHGAVMGVELLREGEIEIVHPDIVVIADGSNSRFGRAVGAMRDRTYPYALAARGYYPSEASEDPFLESYLDIRDDSGRTLPGYGWVFPLGDGTVNLGVGVMSTFKGWKDVNTNQLLAALEGTVPDYWGIDPELRLARPRGGKIPMAFSVGPKAGPNWLLVGDAAGAVNPFNGEGIDYAYETGRMAAEHIHAALGSTDGALLHGYPQALEDAFGFYHRVARLFVTLIGRPAVLRALVTVGFRSRPLMEWVLKAMANLLEPSEWALAERAFRLAEMVAQAAPEPALLSSRG